MAVGCITTYANQCLSPLTLWVRIPLRRGVLNTTLCDKVCRWLSTVRWLIPGTLVLLIQAVHCNIFTYRFNFYCEKRQHCPLSCKAWLQRYLACFYLFNEFNSKGLHVHVWCKAMKSMLTSSFPTIPFKVRKFHS
jgi:hypothetical protein